MSQPGSRFLQLPRELRDEIYAHYLWEETGYVHVAKTNKLQRADGRPIDLALIRTCRLVAEEMRGLPLKVNSITFKSYCPEVVASEKEDVWSAWSIAGRYDYLLDRLWFAKEEAFAVAASFYGEDLFFSSNLKYQPFATRPGSCLTDDACKAWITFADFMP
jgi:hypothetical protein